MSLLLCLKVKIFVLILTSKKKRDSALQKIKHARLTRGAHNSGIVLI